MTDIHVTDETFEAEVLGSDVPVLVDFWAAWCGPCRMVAPVLAELAQEYDGRVKIVKVDTEANPVVVGQYGVVSIPLLNFYAGGELVRSLAGARPKQIIAQEIEGVLAEVGGASGAGVGAGEVGVGGAVVGGAATVADDARDAGAPAASGPSAVSAQA